MAIKDGLNIEFERFDESNFERYEDLILGNVYDQLLLTDDFESSGLLAAGALDAGQGDRPVGAVIASLLKDNEVFIHSIFVDEKYERCGIGSELIRVLIDLASDIFGPAPKLRFNEDITHEKNRPLGPEDIENSETVYCVNEFIHLDFCLPPEEHKAFMAFLKKAGFTDFSDGAPLYSFERAELAAEPMTRAAFRPGFSKAENVYCLGEAAGAHLSELDAFLDSMGLDSEAMYSTFTGKNGEADFIILVSYGGNDDFIITSVATADNGADSISDEAWLECLKASVRAISKDHADFTLFADMNANARPDFWAALAKTCGTAYPRTEAGMYVTVTY